MLAWVLAAQAGTKGVESVQLPAEALDAAHASRRVALVVGVQDYDDPALGELLYPLDDARAFARVLEAPELGDFDRVEVLEAPTRSQFDAAFSELTAGLQGQDTVLVYFSGHGVLVVDEQATAYLLFQDGELQRAAETGLALPELEARLQALPARQRVLIADACQSEDLPAGFRLKGGLGTEHSPPTGADAWLYSATKGQASREDDALGHGVYTHFLLEAMGGAGDRDADGLVDTAEAHRWAAEQTWSWTDAAQVPTMVVTEVGHEPIYLSGDPERREELEAARLAAAPSPAPDQGQRLRGASEARWWLGVEGGWTSAGDQSLVVPWSAGLSLRSERGPWVLGGRTAQYVGRAPFGADWTQLGEASLQAALTRGDTLSLGPQLGAGAPWRVGSGTEVSPVLELGVLLRLRVGRVGVALEPHVQVLAVNDTPAWAALPGLRLSGGPWF